MISTKEPPLTIPCVHADCAACRYVNWESEAFGAHFAVHATTLSIPLLLGDRKAWVRAECCALAA